MSSSFHFTPEDFLECLRVPQLKIGLWIDLTNTTRYYDPDVIKDAGIEYHKLKMPGHGASPARDQVKKFFSIIEDFYKKKPFRLDCVGVHCTHGFNRTGYLIVAFMVEKIGYPVEAALQEFAANRPPGIYRQAYVDELMKKYKATRRPPMVRTPMWALARETDRGDRSPDSPPVDRDDRRRRRKSSHSEGERDSDSRTGGSSKRKRRDSSRSPGKRRKS